jgi:Lipopolysaccharide kinase (Kdo/WaaP) family
MMHIAPPFQAVLTQINFIAADVFTNPAIKPWRTLTDRENCTWDLSIPGQGRIRLHVKRFAPHLPARDPARLEAGGYAALRRHGIPTADVVAWGRHQRRGFIITQDLDGFKAADKLVEAGIPFERLLIPTAELAAALHNAGLHHRDLYLCHFLGRVERSDVQLRLIDAARVRALPGALTRRRWIVKDLAQFRYSTMALPVTEAQRQRWLEHYAGQTHAPRFDALRKSIARKCEAIAAHDRRLRVRQPGRHVSIPQI